LLAFIRLPRCGIGWRQFAAGAQRKVSHVESYLALGSHQRGTKVASNPIITANNWVWYDFGAKFMVPILG